MKKTELTTEMKQFVTERHLASLTLVTPEGRPHVTPVGFTWDEDQKLVRVNMGRKHEIKNTHSS